MFCVKYPSQYEGKHNEIPIIDGFNLNFKIKSRLIDFSTRPSFKTFSSTLAPSSYAQLYIRNSGILFAFSLHRRIFFVCFHPIDIQIKADIKMDMIKSQIRFTSIHIQMLSIPLLPMRIHCRGVLKIYRNVIKCPYSV